MNDPLDDQPITIGCSLLSDLRNTGHYPLLYGRVSTDLSIFRDILF